MTTTLVREAPSAPTTPASSPISPDISDVPVRRSTALRAIADAYTQRRLRRRIERQVQGSYAWRPSPH